MHETLAVLLAEDDPNEAFLMQRAFAEVGITNPLMVARNGKEAIEYLKGAGDYADRVQHPEPCLLLLDLKMPGTDGFDVLAWIRGQPRLQLTLPVIVLTDSYNNNDMQNALSLGAIGLFVKPFDHETRVKLLRELKALYLTPGWPLHPTPGQPLSSNIPFYVFSSPPHNSRN